MKITLCSIYHLTASQGAPKVSIEVADGLRRLGHEVTLIGPADYGDRDRESRDGRLLSEWIWKHAAYADVIEVDHEALPVSRRSLPERPLIVARSMLLVQHLRTLRIPRSTVIRDRLRHLRYWWRNHAHITERLSRSDKTLAAADLINVCNESDRDVLVAQGIPPAKICVFPFGLTDQRRADLSDKAMSRNGRPTVGIVGTFDERKGACELPRLWSAIRQAIPDARLALIGSGHLAVERILKRFRAIDRNSIHIVPRFAPAELPDLLREITVGIFPSYYEGFPFGVLEMMTAGVPVVAYNAPGAPMMVPAALLVPSGDWKAMANRVVNLLVGPQGEIERLRASSVAIAGGFEWPSILEKTIERYQQEIDTITANRATVGPATQGA